MVIKNLKKTAQRILKAIKNKEKIVLYGDADLDGVSSVIILKEAILNLGGSTFSGYPISQIYFPDREEEGYGVTKEAIEFLKNQSPALLISLDCGISNFEEIKELNKFGFKVIVIDHHEILDELPEAEIVIDPKQKGDKSPFKYLATAGIIFKLAAEILKGKFSDSLRKNFLELVAIATLADMMPQVEENQILIEEGLNSLRDSWRPGLRVFLEMGDFKNPLELAHKITSTLNASEKVDHLNETYLLLTERDVEKAKELAENLSEKSYQKHLEIKEIVNEIEEEIFKEGNEKIIFKGSKNWKMSFLGSVASRICQKYQKPTFLFKIGDSESQGAVRVPEGIDSVGLMKKCKEHLITFGGHPPASGFRIKNANLEKFKRCLINQL